MKSSINLKIYTIMAIKRILTTLFGVELLSEKDYLRVDKLVPLSGSITKNNEKSKKILDGIVSSEVQSFLVTTGLGVDESGKGTAYTLHFMTGALVPMERIENLYKTLDDKQKEVIKLHLLGYTVEEITSELNVKCGYVIYNIMHLNIFYKKLFLFRF